MNSEKQAIARTHYMALSDGFSEEDKAVRVARAMEIKLSTAQRLIRKWELPLGVERLAAHARANATTRAERLQAVKDIERITTALGIEITPDMHVPIEGSDMTTAERAADERAATESEERAETDWQEESARRAEVERQRNSPQIQTLAELLTTDRPKANVS